ncbi:uncharacterized protein LOC143911068 [Arctopsyche grandis]|uniref:uncharacterized protein LOC143911068 n=1 Tax=Arctopsyche grandis TaxID=121162 RepID=UPI00406D9FCA
MDCSDSYFIPEKTQINSDVPKQIVKDSTPIRTTIVNYDDFNVDQNPFASRMKLRNSQDRDPIPDKKEDLTESINFSSENPFVSKSKLRNSVERDFSPNSTLTDVKNNNSFVIDSQQTATKKPTTPPSNGLSTNGNGNNKNDECKVVTDIAINNTAQITKPISDSIDVIRNSSNLSAKNPGASSVEKYPTVVVEQPNNKLPNDTCVNNNKQKDNSINMDDRILTSDSKTNTTTLNDSNNRQENAKVQPHDLIDDWKIGSQEKMDASQNLKPAKEHIDVLKLAEIEMERIATKVSNFNSPIVSLQNKRVDVLNKNSKANLSPMSKSGDLMGLSPVSHTNKGTSEFVPPAQNLTNDFLTGREFLTDYNDIADELMDMDDDDFKTPAELFKDPAAFDFLLTCGNSGSNGKGAPARDFGKESLFVKFDPLVGLPTGVRPGRETETVQLQSDISTASHKIDEDVSTASGLAESCSSDSSVSAINYDQGKTLSTMSSVEQSLGVLSLQTQSSQPLIASVPAIPHSINSNVNLQTIEKPTQVVSPAKSLRQQYQPCTPPQSQPVSKNNLPVSPAIAVIDRLINLGLNSPPPPPPVIQPKPEPEMDPQLLNELHSVREMLGNQEQELKQANERIASLQQQLSEGSEREQSLIERVNEKNRNHRQMSVVMEEYEKTMSQLIGEREVEKRQWLEERATLVSERDDASKHLGSIEHSFNDIHAKYERCKTVIQTYKTNEEILKQTVARNEENLKKQVERYEQLRQHAMIQLDKASLEIDGVRKSSQAEIIKLQAMLKKSEIQISSLQESLTQKTKNCEELTSICDELINKVG